MGIKNKALLGTITAITLICAGKTAYAALDVSTADALDQYLAKTAYFEIYDQERRAPSSVSDAGEENVMLLGGNLGYRATDISLPGKGGFDVNLVRKYNSDASLREGGYQVIGHRAVARTYEYWYDDSHKQVYRYYLNGDTASPIYIAFDSEDQMLSFETNGVIHTSSTYTSAQITDWGPENDNHYVWNKTQDNIGFSQGMPFYNGNALPSGSAVSLVRDRASRPDDLLFVSRKHYYYTKSDIGRTYGIGHGWGIETASASMDIYRWMGETTQNPNYQDCTQENGTFTDPDNGIVVEYEAIYRDIDGIFQSKRNRMKMSNEDGTSSNVNMYQLEMRGSSIYADPYQYPTATAPTDDWHMKITRYDGVSFYFLPGKHSEQFMLTKKTDKHGNTIYYYGENADSGIIDTYGRNIHFERQNGNITRITVNNIPVVEYTCSVENDAVNASDKMKENAEEKM